MSQSPTPAELELIAQLLSEGKTATEIGAVIKRTKGSVMGIVHRHLRPRGLGFLPRPPATTERRRPRVVLLENLKRRQAVEKTEELTFGRLLKPMAKRLIELNSGDCRYPVQEVPGLQGRYLFCACPVVPGRFYCSEHWKVCNQTPPHMRRKA